MKLSGHLIYVFVIAVFAWLVVTIETPFGAATTIDSLGYLDIARNLHNGHGALATDFSLENVERKNYREQRLWPVLYPAALSLVINGLPDVSAVALLNKLLFAFTALLVYVILSRYLHRVPALIATLLFCITVPMLTVFTYTWSETLFIPLMLLALWLAIQYIEYSPERQWPGLPWPRRYLYIALVIVLLGLFFTRYIGIVFSVVLPLLFYRMQQGDKKTCGVFLLVYVLAMMQALLANYIITGSVSGGIRAASGTSFIDNVNDIVSVLQYLVSVPPLIGVILLVLIVAVGAGYRMYDGGNEGDEPNNTFTIMGVLVFVVGVYLSAMLLLRTYSQFDRLDLRLLAPVFPFLWLLLCIGAATAIATKRGIIPFVLAGFFILLLPVKGYFHLLSSMESWRTTGSPAHHGTLTGQYKNFTLPDKHNPIRQAFVPLVSKGSVIVTSEPLIFEFTLNIKTVLAPAVYSLSSLRQINLLPQDSLLVYGRGRDPFAGLRNAGYRIESRYLDMGDVMVLKIPVNAVE